jgi:hypothetical protein
LHHLNTKEERVKEDDMKRKQDKERRIREVKRKRKGGNLYFVLYLVV